MNEQDVRKSLSAHAPYLDYASIFKNAHPFSPRPHTAVTVISGGEGVFLVSGHLDNALVHVSGKQLYVHTSRVSITTDVLRSEQGQNQRQRSRRTEPSLFVLSGPSRFRRP